MTRDEWLAVLATEPLTDRQLGAVLCQFRRLGLDDPEDRAERLAISAALAARDEITSTTDLTMGEAGRLINALQHCRDRAELADAASIEHERQAGTAAVEHERQAVEAGSAEPRMGWAEALRYLVAAVAGAWPPGGALPGESAGGGVAADHGREG